MASTLKIIGNAPASGCGTGGACESHDHGDHAHGAKEGFEGDRVPVHYSSSSHVAPAESFAGKAAVITLGCAKNQVDSEVMIGVLQKSGYEIVTDMASADVALVNTCGFLQSAVKAVGDVPSTVSTETIAGDPAEAIIKIADTRKCDLIVMGSRGLGRLAGLVLGSVSQKVVSHAPCPVLIVR